VRKADKGTDEATLNELSKRILDRRYPGVRITNSADLCISAVETSLSSSDGTPQSPCGPVAMKAPQSHGRASPCRSRFRSSASSWALWSASATGERRRNR